MHLYRLDLEVKRDEGEDQALTHTRSTPATQSVNRATHLEILHQVVEHAKTLRVVAVRNLDQRAYLRRLA